MPPTFFLLFLGVAWAATVPAGTIFKGRELDRELRESCLKQPVLGDKTSTQVFEYSTKAQNHFQFEQARFSKSMAGANGNPDCVRERQIVKVVKSPLRELSTLYDSKFYEPPYCDQPVRRLSVPSVYEIAEGIKSESSRNLVVLQLDSSTLPCPDSTYLNIRRFLFFDASENYKLLLDVEADFVVPEIGDNVYRVHIRGAKRVLSTSDAFTEGELPHSITVRKGKFKLAWTAPIKPQSSTAPQTAERITLNEIYSKDKNHVYFETADSSGKIDGVDVSTFQLLSTSGESAYTKDAKRVYFFGETVPDADATTFVQLNDRHGKDLRHVFLMKDIITGVDVASFDTPYKNVWYARDKAFVYSSGKKFKLADPDSFATGDDRSCGKNCSYRNEDKRYRYNHADRVVQELKSPTR